MVYLYNQLVKTNPNYAHSLTRSQTPLQYSPLPDPNKKKFNLLKELHPIKKILNIQLNSRLIYHQIRETKPNI